MRLKDRVESGVFTTLIEVFPPNFSAQAAKEPLIGIRQKTRDLIARVARISDLADAILVADMKDTGKLGLASVHTAALLKEELGVEVIPVLPARDMNRKGIRTSFLTALSSGIESVALVWGDRFMEDEGTKNVYDFRSLAEVVKDMRALSDRADIDASILCPVDISSLPTARGARIAQARLRSGANFLLAQPPTSDVAVTLESQQEILRESKMQAKVLPNVFPFRSLEDVRACRARFGWNIPNALDIIAEGGERSLLKEARSVVDSLRGRKFPGVYVSTRGRPELAKFILG